MIDSVKPHLSSMTLDLKSQLIEDYLYTRDAPPLALSETGSLVAIGGGLAAVDNDRIVFFERNRQSQSGWKAVPIHIERPEAAIEPGIVSVIGFEIDANRTMNLNLLCLFKARTGFAVRWMSRHGDGPWKPANLSVGAASLVSNVSSIDAFDCGNGRGWFVYGTAVGFPFYERNDSRFFTLYFENCNRFADDPWLAGAQIDVLKFGDFAQTARPRFSFLTVGTFDAPRTAALAWWDESQPKATVAWTRVNFTTTGFDPNVNWRAAPTFAVGNPIAAFVPMRNNLDTSTAWPVLAITGENERILRRYKFPQSGNDVADLILNVSTETISPITLADGTYSIFSISRATGTLNLLREIDSNPNWVDLGNRVKAIAAPNSECSVKNRKTLEVFYASPAKTASAQEDGGKQTYNIVHLSQDTGKHQWIPDPVGDIVETTTDADGKPVAPTQVSSIAIDLTVKDGTGAGVADARIYVTSNQWTSLIIDDLCYWVGPGSDASFQTNSLGVVSMRYEARSLRFPKLDFTAEKDGVSHSRWCQGDMIEPVEADKVWGTPTTTVRHRLNGDDKEFNVIDKAKAAKLVPKGSTKTDEDKLTDLLQTCGKWMIDKQNKAFGEDWNEPRTWSFSRADSGFWIEELLGDARPQWPPQSIFSHIWGDVTHFAKHALNKIEDWTVTVAKEGLAVTVRLGERTLDATADTIEAAGDLVETIFTAISTAAGEIIKFIKEVVAFLRMLFEWKDIIITHNVVRYMVDWTLQYGRGEVETVRDKFDGLMKDAKTELDKALNDLKQKLEPQRKATANDFVGANSGGKGNATQISHPYGAHAHHQSASLYYAYNRGLSHIGPGVTARVSAFSSEPIANLTTKLKTHWANDAGKQKAATTQNALSGPNSSIKLSNLLDLALYELLGIVEDIAKFALDGLTFVIDALFDLLVELIDSFYELLNHPIEIPVLTWIYAELTYGSKLSILDLLCLIFAAPITILYKLIASGKAPFSEADVATVKTVFCFKDGKAQIDFAALSAPRSGVTASVKTWLESIFGYVSGASTVIGAVPSIYVDYKALKDGFDGNKESSSKLVTAAGWCSVAFGLISNGFSLPLGTFCEWHEDKGVNLATVSQTILWGLQFLPIGCDAGFLIFSDDHKQTRAYLSEEGEVNWGPVVEALFGYVTIPAATLFVSYGAAHHIDTATVWDYINAYIGNVARMSRIGIAMADPLYIEDSVVVIPGVLIVDAVASLASGAFSITEAALTQELVPAAG